MHENYGQAAYAIGLAIILDMLDGRIARLTNSSTDFGLQLDSLADVISFGVAPSVLALVWGLSTVDFRLAWTAAFTFTICGAMRLARFNVQAANLKHFVGLPIPAGGGIIAAIVHFSRIHKKSFGRQFDGRVRFFYGVPDDQHDSLQQPEAPYPGKKSHLAILVMALLVALF